MEIGPADHIEQRSDECIHLIYPATACHLCYPPPKPVTVPTISTFDVAYPFTARFHGTCAECDKVVAPGDDMAHLTDGRNVCGECVGME